MGVRGQLSVPSVVLGAETMAGPSLYGSFRTGLFFGGGNDEKVGDIGSRWGITGSHEVAEGLTASYKYEIGINTASAYLGALDREKEEPKKIKGVQGRHSNVSLSGGFGTVTLGQFWSASAIHYGFAVDGSYWNGTFGGASTRPGRSVSYSSSAGDVSFQIDKVINADPNAKPGTEERVELGASASFGPVGVGLGFWSSDVDDSSFTGVAVSAGAAGVNLTIGLGSTDDTDGNGSDTNIVRINGAVGDTGLSYSVQLSSSDIASQDKNVIILTNSLGAGASLIFEHKDPGEGESSSLLGLKVDF